MRLPRVQGWEEVNYATILEALAEMNPEALQADGLEDALIGYTLNHHHTHVAVYDYDKCIEVHVTRDGMSREDADEFLSFNTLDAYVGENGPLFIRMFNDEEA
jgi:hypothetical protein